MAAEVRVMTGTSGFQTTRQAAEEYVKAHPEAKIVETTRVTTTEPTPEPTPEPAPEPAPVPEPEPEPARRRASSSG